MIENIKRINLILQLRKLGVTNHLVLSILEKIPREQFIDKELFYKAYQNNALPIDCNQTISQPAVVAKMTELLESKKTFNVLRNQMRNSLSKNFDYKKIIIAYEPVWSIGTGKTPKLSDLKKTLKFIKLEFQKIFNKLS